jgi:UDP-N-acetylmuramate--alanine ligase
MSLLRNKRWIHFIGIGGIGMSGLAELLLKLGSKVSGSDTTDSDIIRRLKSLGAEVFLEHSSQIFKQSDSESEPDCIVYSSAVSPSNPELVYGEKKGIPIIRRAEMLAEIMRLKRGLAVAGSHGKTTTTGMISLILKKCGFDPTVVIGGKFDAIGSNAAWGTGDWMVAEADESDGSFLRLSPEIAVVTNIDKEHLDHYKSLDKAKEIFLDFLDRLPFYGRAILCSDCSHLRDVGSHLKKSKIWYGLEKEFLPDYWIDIENESYPTRFSVYSKSTNYKEKLLETFLGIPGRHNVLNSVGALLAAKELGADWVKASDALKEFSGVRKRFEKKGFLMGDVMVIEDYAHHPTEIRATLEASRSYFGNESELVVLFQPHRYTRTRDLWNEFEDCFKEGDKIFTLPIYPASEPKLADYEKFDMQNFARHVDGEFVQNLAEASQVVTDYFKNHKSNRKKAFLILGAGDVAKIVNELGIVKG